MMAFNIVKLLKQNSMKKPLLFLLIAMSFIFACGKKRPVVTTFAGNGAMAYKDGKGADASFSNLMGLALDAAGDVYVADSRNNLIRKISPDGVVTTLAGSGVVGSADGKGTAASFFYPVAITADKNGNVYVADTHNSLIRKISPDGTVTTLAGRPEAKNKRPIFDNPMAITTDAAGNVFIADWINDQIRKISPRGEVTTVAGSGAPGAKDGKGLAATFYLPEGIAADDKGNLYVSDTYNNLIRKINKDGVVTTLAGKLKKGSANGKGAAASFSHPAGIAVDKKGYVYVADDGNNLIRMISPGGLVTTFAGTGDRGKQDGDAETATFYRPLGVAADTAGNLYIADYQNNLVRKISR